VILKINCPECDKFFKIDVPLIEKLKEENLRLRQEINNVKNGYDPGLSGLMKIFGME
jgi:hypothetical protein